MLHWSVGSCHELFLLQQSGMCCPGHLLFPSGVVPFDTWSISLQPSGQGWDAAGGRQHSTEVPQGPARLLVSSASAPVSVLADRTWPSFHWVGRPEGTLGNEARGRVQA